MVGKERATGTARRATRWAALLGAAALTAAGGVSPAWASPGHGGHPGSTATPVKHLVVIFDENNSFDHYFGTYPHAANTDGTPFHASKNTPKDINTMAHAGLVKKNPNQYKPKRLTPSQAVTCDQIHSYGPEQYAANGGKADKYVQNTEVSKCTGMYGEPGLVMDYYDGNTVTGLWNYAQHYALSDNSFGSAYGPSSPGAIELVSANTHGVISTDPKSSTEDPKQTDKPDKSVVSSPNSKGVGTLTNDPDPAYDDCSDADHTTGAALGEFKTRNIGDLLNAKHVSWGWFQGGFRPSTAWDGKSGDMAKCGGTTHANVAGAASVDYSPHHEPFQFYKSTANPHHLPPKNIAEIGHDGQANHQYDLSDFDATAKAGNLPSVSFLKAPEYQDGHAGYSDPIDEQHFLTKQINTVQKSPQWKDTAVVVAYDDSDGWYDHVAAKVQNGSTDSTKDTNGKATDAPGCQKGPKPVGGYQDRCGPGARQPLLVISPYSRVNAVDHTQTEQASITRFIEDNWHTGRLGDSAFDERAKPLTHMFDFHHPNNTQLLLKSNGAVASVGPIPPHSATPASAPSRGDIASQTDDSSSFALPLGITVGAVVIGGIGVGLALHRSRRSRVTA